MTDEELQASLRALRDVERRRRRLHRNDPERKALLDDEEWLRRRILALDPSTGSATNGVTGKGATAKA